MLELLLKCFCVFLFLGLEAEAKLDAGKVNITKFHTPAIRSTFSAAQPFWDPDFCNDWEDLDAFPHPDSCWQYLICWNGELWEDECPVGENFDPWEGVCDDEDVVICLDDEWPETPPDDECPPPGSNEVRFLPSPYCDEFYICINGQPILLFCRPGQHWNIEQEFCDDPEHAGCEQNGPPADQLPDCPSGFTGQLPHPHNCNWFIHCNNGNRSIQQCQHLHHFDIDLRRCVFQTAARCIKQARF